MRVRKRNLVYLIGIPQSIACEKILLQKPYLSQYGTIRKIILNSYGSYHRPSHSSFSAYITFEQESEAAFAILGLDGFEFEDLVLRASFGMTKYCSFFLRNMKCHSKDCLFLHQLGRKEDVIVRDESDTTKGSAHEDIDILAKRVSSFHMEELQEKLKDVLSFPPVLGSLKRVYELVSKLVIERNFSKMKELGPLKLKSTKSEIIRKSKVVPKTGKVSRWDDESDKEIHQDSVSTHSVTRAQGKVSHESMDFINDCGSSTQPSSLNRSENHSTFHQHIKNRSPGHSPSPTLEESIRSSRKSSVSIERKSNTGILTDSPLTQTFSRDFFNTHREVFDLGEKMLENPLINLRPHKIIETDLDKMIVERLTSDFHSIVTRKTSAYKFPMKNELCEDFDAIMERRPQKPLMEAFLNLKLEAYEPKEETFSLYGQTYQVSRRN